MYDLSAVLDRVLIVDTGPPASAVSAAAAAAASAATADNDNDRADAAFACGPGSRPTSAELDRLAAVCHRTDLSVRMSPGQKYAFLALARRRRSLRLPSFLARRIFDYCVFTSAADAQNPAAGALGFFLSLRGVRFRGHVRMMVMRVAQGAVVVHVDARSLGGNGNECTLCRVAYVPQHQIAVVAVTFLGSKFGLPPGYLHTIEAADLYLDRLRLTLHLTANHETTSGAADSSVDEKEKGGGDYRPETARLARLRTALKKQHVSSVTGVRCISARQQRWCQYAKKTRRRKATAFIRNLPPRDLPPTRGGGKMEHR